MLSNEDMKGRQEGQEKDVMRTRKVDKKDRTKM